MPATQDGVPFIRTPEKNFEGLADYPWEPRYHDVEGLRMHYVDAGSGDRPVALLLHGMPTWSYLYRTMIPPLVAAGYRCIAPDHIGFGRSDKVVDSGWYSIARHTANMRSLVKALDLRDVSLFVQDWGGPIGLAQCATMPERFTRLVILNTWLHHPGYEYSPAIVSWIEANSPGGFLRENIPDRFNWGLLMALATRRATPAESVLGAVSGAGTRLSAEADGTRRAYDAPFVGLGEGAVAGPRRFPLCIPYNDPVAGNADEQTRYFGVVNSTPRPVHFMWGIEDDVFTPEWGRKWASLIPHATWDDFPAGHFLQDTHGSRIVSRFLERSAS